MKHEHKKKRDQRIALEAARQFFFFHSEMPEPERMSYVISKVAASFRCTPEIVRRACVKWPVTPDQLAQYAQTVEDAVIHKVAEKFGVSDEEVRQARAENPISPTLLDEYCQFVKTAGRDGDVFVWGSSH